MFDFTLSSRRRTLQASFVSFITLAVLLAAPTQLAAQDAGEGAERVAPDQASAKAEAKPRFEAYRETIPGTGVSFALRPIPAGTFTIGSPDDEAGRKAAEGPQRRVAIAAFWMGACEVTWQEYELWQLDLDRQRRKVLAKEPQERDGAADAITRPTKPYADMTFGMGQDGYPAICMTQLAAKVYCQWLSAKTGRYYRLPTEAEWEYACRAGTTTRYHFGDDAEVLGDYAWYADNSDEKYHKVGTKKPNPWGLFDMHGNVSEWCLDAFYGDSYAKHWPVGDLVKDPYVVPKTLFPRVARGGSWDDDADELRAARRIASDEDWKMQDPQIPQSVWYHTDALFLGFRVVRPLVEPSKEAQARFHYMTEEERKNMRSMR